MKNKTIMPIFGTRPEAIKMCPLIRELWRREGVRVKLCVTGQHRELLSQALDIFGVTPDIDLALMKERQTQESFLSALLNALPEVLRRVRPDLVLVHGDTASAYGAALVCFLRGIPVAHVEAGLRTHDIHFPFPEEFYRQSIARMASLHFAPTEGARENLLAEGVEPSRIFVTGNTGIDALDYTVRKHDPPAILSFAKDRKLILVTAHRRESQGEALLNMLSAIRAVAREREDIRVIISAHPNPSVNALTREIFGGERRCLVVSPPDVSDFHTLMAHAHLILTDSGGIQEEAPALGVPVLVMRNETERQEGIDAGTLCLVGTSFRDVYDGFCRLLDDEALYTRMKNAKNPYGDGRASRRIADVLMNVN